MSNENKIRILYIQPGKYPEERFVANELPPFSGLSAGICKPYTRGQRTMWRLSATIRARWTVCR